MHPVRQAASSEQVLSGHAAREIVRAALLLAGLVAGALAVRALPFAPRQFAPTGQGAGTFMAIAALALAVGAPRQAVAFAGGYAFGFWEGAALAWASAGLACAADFFWARAIGRAWVRRRLSGRLARADAFLAAHPFSATLGLRLLPVGNNLALNLAAGVSAVAPAPFLAASLLGYLPQTAIFALLGQGVRVAEAVQIAAGAAMFAASGLIGAALLRRYRRFGGAVPLSAGACKRPDGAMPPA